MKLKIFQTILCILIFAIPFVFPDFKWLYIPFLLIFLLSLWLPYKRK